MKLIDKISYKIKQEIELIQYKIADIRLRIQMRGLKNDLAKRQPRRLNKLTGYMLYRKLLRNAPQYAISLNHNSFTKAHIGNSVSFVTDGWDVYAVHYDEKYYPDKKHEYIANVENKNLQSFNFTGNRARKIYEYAKQYCR